MGNETDPVRAVMSADENGQNDKRFYSLTELAEMEPNFEK